MNVFIWAVTAIISIATGGLFAILDFYYLAVIFFVTALIAIIFLYDSFDKSGWQ